MMMANKPLLHELLKEDQEPFQLHRFISDRRSQLAKKSSPMPPRKRRPISAGGSSSSLCRRACFFSFPDSPDVRMSPFRDLPFSPMKSPHRAAVLHIPTRTAAHLAEAAMRIRKQRQSNDKTQTLGLGLFGSFLRRLKDRSTNIKRAIGSSDFNVTVQSEQKSRETVRISSFRSKRRLSSAEWTKNNEDNSLEFEASTSGYSSDCSGDMTDDFGFPESRFCASPFRFSFHRSPPSTGRRTPDFCSPDASPCCPAKLQEESSEYVNSDEVVLGQEEEEKEQSSPVSVLDPPFEDDDGPENADAELEDYDVECSYINVQRAKEQLLHRLQRFEKLADMDPMELEKKLLEESDSGDWKEFEDDDLIAYNSCGIQFHSMNMPINLTKLPFDEKYETTCPIGGIEATINCNGLESWNGGLTPFSSMMGLDFEHETWTKFDEHVGETAADIEVAVFGLLVEEVSEELSYYTT